MKPLAGRTIVITRSREQSLDLASRLADHGARVVEAPVISIAEPSDWGPADQALGRLEAYDTIILTSVNAVERFDSRIKVLGSSLSANIRLIAIGPATAQRMTLLGMRPEGVAADSRAEGLLDLLLAGRPLSGRRILIPRAEVARELLPERLREAGAQVDVVSVYRTIPLPVTSEVLELLRSHQVDAIAFTSGSTVTNMLTSTGGVGALSGVVVAVIGPVTAQTARAAGLKVSIESSSAEMTGLADAIADYFAKSV